MLPWLRSVVTFRNLGPRSLDVGQKLFPQIGELLHSLWLLGGQVVHLARIAVEIHQEQSVILWPRGMVSGVKPRCHLPTWPVA